MVGLELGLGAAAPCHTAPLWGWDFWYQVLGRPCGKKGWNGSIDAGGTDTSLPCFPKVPPVGGSSFQHPDPAWRGTVCLCTILRQLEPLSCDGGSTLHNAASAAGKAPYKPPRPWFLSSLRDGRGGGEQNGAG